MTAESIQRLRMSVEKYVQRFSVSELQPENELTI
jgi:hypothetical protein